MPWFTYYKLFAVQDFLEGKERNFKNWQANPNIELLNEQKVTTQTNTLLNRLFKAMGTEYHQPGDIVITQNLSVLNMDGSIRDSAMVYFVIEGKYGRKSNLNNITEKKGVPEYLSKFDSNSLYQKQLLKHMVTKVIHKKEDGVHKDYLPPGQIFGEISAIYGCRRS